MMQSTRNKDYLIEQITNEFADKYFWPRQLGSFLSCLQRYDDTEHQFAGVDYSLASSKGILNFDSKVKYYGCLNKVLEVPGFEMSFKNNSGRIQDGWLVADGNQTDYYEIVCLSCTTNDHTKLSAFEQICAIDILWVKKSELISYIEQYDSIEHLKQDTKILRECYDRGESYDIIGQMIYNMGAKDYKRYPHKKFHLKYSPRLKEQPVNLVVYRDALESLAHTRHFVVTKEFVKNVFAPVK